MVFEEDLEVSVRSRYIDITTLRVGQCYIDTKTLSLGQRYIDMKT